MKKIIFLLFSFFMLTSCGREVENNPKSIDPTEKYQGRYVGILKNETGQEIGSFVFFVDSSTNASVGDFQMNVNYFSMNSFGISLDNFTVDASGKFTTTVNSYNNFQNKVYRGTMEGNLTETNIGGKFQLTRLESSNNPDVTKGYLSGVKN